MSPLVSVRRWFEALARVIQGPAAASRESAALLRQTFGGALTRRRYRGGFTLTDLTVLTAVLSLLGAIVFTTVASSRAKARLAVCSANLQQVNRAVLTFCADNEAALPTIPPGDTRSIWWYYKEQVKRYVGLTGESSKNDTVFACPEDRGYSDPFPFHLSSRFDFSSYVYNGVTLPGLPNIAGLKLSAVKHPPRTLLVMEWTAHAPLSWHRSKTGRNNSPFYCDAQSVVGFVDGHVNLTRIYYDGYNAAYTRDPIDGYDYQYSEN
jgi:type II secretory pathway pseudopilin PulG